MNVRQISISEFKAHCTEEIREVEKGNVIPEVTPPIAVDATRLPQPFVNRQGNVHKDPIDLIIVATARHHDLTLLTSDQVLLDYTGVRTENSR